MLFHRQVDPFEPPIVFRQSLEVIDVILFLRPIIAHFMGNCGLFVDANIKEHGGQTKGHGLHLV